jgi:hypothetical protein
MPAPAPAPAPAAPAPAPAPAVPEKFYDEWGTELPVFDPNAVDFLTNLHDTYSAGLDLTTPEGRMAKELAIADASKDLGLLSPAAYTALVAQQDVGDGRSDFESDGSGYFWWL